MWRNLLTPFIGSFLLLYVCRFIPKPLYPPIETPTLTYGSLFNYCPIVMLGWHEQLLWMARRNSKVEMGNAMESGSCESLVMSRVRQLQKKKVLGDREIQSTTFFTRTLKYICLAKGWQQQSHTHGPFFNRSANFPRPVGCMD